MSAQRGKDLLLKLGDGGATEIFASVAGLRATTLSLAAESVDATHALSEGGWREILAGAGAKSASIAGSGVFVSGGAAESIRAIFFAGEIRRWRIIIPGAGMIEGPFHIANLDYTGAHDGEATFSIALASAGPLNSTAA
jgi:TP901-1 family phage major tail protein